MVEYFAVSLLNSYREASMRILLLIAALVFSSTLLAADFFKTGMFVYVDGQILVGDDGKFGQLVHDSTSSFIVSINSPGGDVETALAIGRLIRARQAAVSVAASAECASACVLVLAAGVKRIIYDGAKIIIHRPYFDGVLPAGSDYDSYYKKIVEVVNNYLREMNIPTDLAGRMMRIPPHRAETLSMEEISEFMLDADDPAYEQRELSQNAGSLGITVSQLNVRKASAEKVCDLAYQRTTDDDLIFLEFIAAKTCEELILKGNDPSAIRGRLEILLENREKIEALTEETQADCAASFLKNELNEHCPVSR